MVQCLPRKLKALRSNTSIEKQQQQQQKPNKQTSKKTAIEPRLERCKPEITKTK
jgi:hypothetical protein